MSCYAFAETFHIHHTTVFLLAKLREQAFISVRAWTLLSKIFLRVKYLPRSVHYNSFFCYLLLFSPGLLI